jgi:hypothetical protein
MITKYLWVLFRVMEPPEVERVATDLPYSLESTVEYIREKTMSLF